MSPDIIRRTILSVAAAPLADKSVISAIARLETAFPHIAAAVSRPDDACFA